MHKRILSECSVSMCLACSERSDSRARVKYRPRKKRGKTGGKGQGFSRSPQSSIAFPSFSLTLAPYDSTCSPLSDYRKRPIRQKIERCDFRSFMSLGVLISKYVDLLMSIRRCISCRAFLIALSALLAKNREIKRNNEVPQPRNNSSCFLLNK